LSDSKLNSDINLQPSILNNLSKEPFKRAKSIQEDVEDKFEKLMNIPSKDPQWQDVLSKMDTGMFSKSTHYDKRYIWQNDKCAFYSLYPLAKAALRSRISANFFDEVVNFALNDNTATGQLLEWYINRNLEHLDPNYLLKLHYKDNIHQLDNLPWFEWRISGHDNLIGKNSKPFFTPTKNTLFIPLCKNYKSIDGAYYDFKSKILYVYNITVNKDHDDSYSIWMNEELELWRKKMIISGVLFLWIGFRPTCANQLRKNEGWIPLTYFPLQIFKGFKDIPSKYM